MSGHWNRWREKRSFTYFSTPTLKWLKTYSASIWANRIPRLSQRWPNQGAWASSTPWSRPKIAGFAALQTLLITLTLRSGLCHIFRSVSHTLCVSVSVCIPLPDSPFETILRFLQKLLCFSYFFLPKCNNQVLPIQSQFYFAVAILFDWSILST